MPTAHHRIGRRHDTGRRDLAAARVRRLTIGIAAAATAGTGVLIGLAARDTPAHATKATTLPATGGDTNPAGGSPAPSNPGSSSGAITPATVPSTSPQATVPSSGSGPSYTPATVPQYSGSGTQQAPPTQTYQPPHAVTGQT